MRWRSRAAFILSDARRKLLIRPGQNLGIIFCLAIGLLFPTSVFLLAQQLTQYLRSKVPLGFENLISITVADRELSDDEKTVISVRFPGVKILRMYKNARAPVLAGSGYLPSHELSFISAELIDLMNPKPTAGRVFTAGELSSARPVCMLTEAFRSRYRVLAPGISTINVKGHDLSVVGVTDRKNFSDFIIVPSSLISLFSSERNASYFLRFPTMATEEIDLEVGDFLEVELGLPLLSHGAMTEGMTEDIRRTQRYCNLIFLGSLLVLLYAILNIGGLMANRVEERRGEIGVRLALGARRGEIAAQFLVETFALSLVAFALDLAVLPGLFRLLDGAGFSFKVETAQAVACLALPLATSVALTLGIVGRLGRLSIIEVVRS